MGITSIVIIVVLLIVSGFVAWVGDVLGRIMGKRRITLFGLRPRKTSVLIAVMAGVVMTGLTILSLALLRQDYADMLFRYDAIRSQLKAAVDQNNALAQARDAAQTEIYNLTKTADTQKSQISDLTGQLTTSEEELIKLNSELGGLKDQATTMQAEVGKLKSERDKLTAEYKKMEKENTARAADLQAQISTLNTDISSRETRVADLNSQIETLNKSITEISENPPKVKAGQQLAAFKIATNLDSTTLDTQLGTQLAAIRYNFRDPESGQAVLKDNEMEIPGDAFKQAISSIKSLPSDQAVVIAYATENVLKDEAVTLRIEVTGDFKVYSAGTTIFSKVYSKPEDSTDANRAIMASFMEDGKHFLVDERKLLPTGQGELIQLTIDDLVALSGKLKSVGFPARIDMVALTDIYRTDFLVYGKQFDVKVEKVN